jgi:2'-5' RNA ligase
MRLFIALELDEETRSELAEEIAHLAGHHPKIRWVAPENLHVTLQFLGNVEDNAVPEICAAMDEAAAVSSPFDLEIRDLGCFPRPDRPRVVWAGCGIGSEQTVRLARDLGAVLEPIGFPPEKRAFTPHVTIGRVKQPGHAQGIETLLADPQTVLFGHMDVPHMTLFMSETKREGPRYSPMYRCNLNG